MFGLFQSTERKMRDNADNWLQLADKVFHYRRDQLTDAQQQDLRARITELRLRLKQRADASKLKLGIEALEGVLQQVGGTFYPKSALVENVEFFLVAAIIVLGIRTYFLQPFKIPTNSMWPTYYGLTGQNFAPGAPAPGLAGEAFRFLAFGAQRRTMVAPADGEVSAPFTGRGTLAFTYREGRKWLIIPTRVREYTFYVGGAPARVQVPADFSDFDRMVQETFYPGMAPIPFIEKVAHQGGVQRGEILRQEGTDDMLPVYLVKLGRTVTAGQPIVRFDVLTGDQLFVDRLTYHFFRPRVGQGFVFRTRHIAAIGADQYYIKRLVGEPGDTIEIRQPVLYRNGKPITGAEAFAQNARRQAPYRGYTNTPTDPAYGGKYLFAGDSLTVPPRTFFALGDNSGNSEDGRYWGFVPEKDVVGRPLFIYYPFTRRWGPAR